MRPQGMPEHGQISRVPFEAIFKAAKVMNPTFRFDDVDVVIPYNILQKLFAQLRPETREFRSPGWYRNGYHMFTVHRTLFLHNHSTPWAVHYAPAQAGCDYGSSFEKEVASPQMNNYVAEGMARGRSYQENHYRAFKIQLGDLKCVVLFEADARLGNSDPSKSLSNETPSGWSRPRVAFWSLDQAVPIVRTGSGAPQSEIAQLKCRYTGPYSRNYQAYLQSRTGTEWVDEGYEWVPESRDAGYANFNDDLWHYFFFTQRPHLITGFRNADGVLQSIRRSHTSKGTHRSASRHARDLCRLVELFHQLRDFTSKRGHPCVGRFEPEENGAKGPIRDRSALWVKRCDELDRHPLPRSIVDEFWDQPVPEVAEEQEHFNEPPSQSRIPASSLGVKRKRPATTQIKPRRNTQKTESTIARPGGTSRSRRGLPGAQVENHVASVPSSNNQTALPVRFNKRQPPTMGPPPTI